MPNKNYLAGRRLEYQLRTVGLQHGWQAARSAGSHGLWDVIWWRPAGVGSAPTLMDEHLKDAGWMPYYEIEKMPRNLRDQEIPVSGYYRFGRGLHRSIIWCWCCGDGYSQAIFIQCKRKST